jgi:hypothetical protein
MRGREGEREHMFIVFAMFVKQSIHEIKDNRIISEI